MELESLVADWLARRSLGHANALEELCALHPEHAESLRRRVATIVELGLTTTERTPTADEAVGTSPPAERLARLREQTRSASARYEILDEIGRGGMGIVLRARDLGLGRGIAMKVVLGDVGQERDGTAVDPDLLQRFLDEAQITGQIDHPGVVPVHELGIDGAGRPFFTMRLVRGETADKIFAKARAGESGWTETRALDVILKVCDTVAFAHQKGVLHRDIKPANVMVGRYGEVYVLDWGLAKVRGQPEHRDLRIRPESTVSKVRTDRSKAEADSDSPLLTMDGAVVGTPSYMSPEQAEGRVEVLDERADVYAVGAMLYQLLTGSQPYVRPGARVSPYAVLAAVHAGPPAAVHALRKDVPAELAAICERAMARDLPRRYASMRDLSDDLRAYLEKRVVKAYRTGPVVELAMWVRRNRALAGAMAAAALALVGGIVATGLFARRASTVAAEQKEQLVQASWGAFNQADRLFAQADAPGSAAAGIPAAREGLLHLARAVSFDPTNRVAWERFSLEAARRKALWCLPNEVAVLAHEDPVHSATFSPDASRVLTASGNTATLWDASSGKTVQTFSHTKLVRSAVLCSDGTRVLTASFDTTAKLWDAGDGLALRTFAHEDAVGSASLSPDGTRVLTASRRTANLWDAGSGTLLHTFAHEHDVEAASFSPEGTRVVTASTDKTARLWDAGTGELLHTFGHGHQVVSAGFDADGTRVVTASADKNARLWDAGTAQLIHTFAHDYFVLSAAVSPDGTRVLTASVDKTAKLWDAGGGKLLRTFAHETMVLSAAFSPDGARALTASGKTAKLWDAGSGRLLQTYAHADDLGAASFSPDGTHVVTASSDKTAKVWDTGSESAGLTFAHEDRVASATFGLAGTRVLTASDDKSAKLWDADSGKLLRTFAHEASVTSATCSPDGARVLTAGWDGTAKLWDAGSAQLQHTFAHEAGVWSATFSPDGTRVFTASHDQSAKLWDAGSGKLLHSLGHEDGVRSAAFSPDGNRGLTVVLMSGPTGGGASLWDVGSGKLLHFFAHGTSGTFSPDGTRVLTAGYAARLWDTGSGEQLLSFADDLIGGFAMFSPDGSRVLTAGAYDEMGVRLWDSATGKMLRSFGHEHLVLSATYAPDGARVLTSGVDKSARLWDNASGKLLHSFAYEGSVSAATFSPDGTRVLTTSGATAAIRTLSHAQTPTPPWGGDHVAQARALAEILTGQSVSLQSELMDLPPERRAHLRATWQTLLAAGAPFGPLVRWLDAHGPESQAHPGSSITCRERADILIANGGAIGTREALHFDPSHPLVHIALAAHESVPGDVPPADRPAMEAAAAVRREFLRDYGLGRLPADATVCARAAAMLLAQGDKPRALQAAHKALALEPTHAEALRAAADARR